MRNRVEEIKAKGFAMTTAQEDRTIDFTSSPLYAPVEFNNMRVGVKTLADATLKLGDYKKANPLLADKQRVLKAINDMDLKMMRDISLFFFRSSGIYRRMLIYMATLYCYDWFVTPFVNDETLKPEAILDRYQKVLRTLDSFKAKKQFGEIALSVLKVGCYYGYKIEQPNNKVVLQELPVNYCRSRYYCGDKPAVEFNMAFFDEYFKDTTYRNRVLKMFPKEFAKGYSLYKQGKLTPDTAGDTNGWYLLDPNMTVKFSMHKDSYPPFISVIPLIIELDEAQDLDRKKTMQRLMKIIIQKMPLDKNGDLVFDVDEAKELHNNAVQMLGRAIGIDVLTTFADVEVADMSDSHATTQADDLERVERQVYNEWGGSQMLFNTSGNLALEKSIHNDEATMADLVYQFEDFLNDIVVKFNKGKKLEFSVQILPTTRDNYKELAKLYKEQTQIGYSKMLPQIALGQSQSGILAAAYFENDILDLVNVFIPPLSSNTMNADILNRNKGGSDNGAGRPEKPDDQKSEKTIQNRESMN